MLAPLGQWRVVIVARNVLVIITPRRAIGARPPAKGRTTVRHVQRGGPPAPLTARTASRCLAASADDVFAIFSPQCVSQPGYSSAHRNGEPPTGLNVFSTSQDAAGSLHPVAHRRDRRAVDRTAAHVGRICTIGREEHHTRTEHRPSALD